MSCGNVEGMEGENCAICFQPIFENDDKLFCNSCGSDFHASCIAIKTNESNNCPICRKSFFIVRASKLKQYRERKEDKTGEGYRKYTGSGSSKPCYYHPEYEAIWKCKKCNNWFCQISRDKSEKIKKFSITDDQRKWYCYNCNSTTLYPKMDLGNFPFPVYYTIIIFLVLIAFIIFSSL